MSDALCPSCRHAAHDYGACGFIFNADGPSALDRGVHGGMPIRHRCRCGHWPTARMEAQRRLIAEGLTEEQAAHVVYGGEDR